MSSLFPGLPGLTCDLRRPKSGAIPTADITSAPNSTSLTRRPASLPDYAYATWLVLRNCNYGPNSA